MPLSYFIVGELLCLVRLLVYFSCTQLILQVVMMLILIFSIFFFFATSIRPCLKRRYHARFEKVKEYLEMVKIFDELISPQSLFLHFLGPKPSKHIWKNIDIVKKSEFITSSSHK